MNLLNKLTKSFNLIYLIGFVSLFFVFELNGQSLELSLQKEYKFYTRNTAIETILSDTKALFLNSTDKAYFNLATYDPGPSTGVIIGKIHSESISYLDTIDGFTPDMLSNMFIDNNENLIYSISNWGGGFVKKIDWNGNIIWENSFVEDTTIIQPYYSYLAKDQSPIILYRILYPDYTYSNTMAKLNTADGSEIWNTDFLIKSNYLIDPIFSRELNDKYQVLSYNRALTHISQIDQNGTLLKSSTKFNAEEIDIFKYGHIDSLGNCYLGLNSWGYRCPKINSDGDTLWVYDKPSPFGDETSNRTTGITSDNNSNIYISGRFKFEQSENYNLLLTKVNSDSEVIWEQFTHEITPEGYTFIPRTSYLNKDKIWISGMNWKDSENYSGAIICYNLEGKLLLFQSIPELNTMGRTASFDFYENDILVTGSTGAWPDSIFQHILHYRVDSVSATQNLPPQILVSPYPNPTSDYISIKDLNIQQIDQFTITDVQGKQMDANGIILKAGNIDLSRLANGIYFLSYFVEEQAYRAKVIKQ